MTAWPSGRHEESPSPQEYHCSSAFVKVPEFAAYVEVKCSVSPIAYALLDDSTVQVPAAGAASVVKSRP